MMKVTTRVTQYLVCALPLDHDEFDAFAITVSWRGDDRWAVTRVGSYLADDDQWHADPGGDERTSKWLASHRFSMDDALRRAQLIAPTVRIHGWTPQEVLQR